MMTDNACCSLVFREALESDADEILVMVNEAYAVHEGPFLKDGRRLDRDTLVAKYIDPLTRSMTLFVCVENSAVIIGCVALQLDRGEKNEGAYFGLLAVKSGIHKKGLAGRLVAFVEDKASKQGYKWIEITVVNLREEWLKNWYRKLGYVYLKTLPMELDRVADAFRETAKLELMRKQLIRSD